MGESGARVGLQEAVERSYREQWGGRRFYLITAVVLFVLAVFCGVVLVVARQWIDPAQRETALKVVEMSGLTMCFVFLMVGVLAGLEALIRWQREEGQIPDRIIHAALTLSGVTVAGLVFLAFLFAVSWMGSGLGERMFWITRFIILLFCGLVWLGSVIMNAAAVTMLLTRRSDLLELNSTNEGTALVLRKGHATEIVKLAVASLVPLIIYAVALLLAGALVVS